MKALKLTNSLTKQKEEFVPIDKFHVKLYACGPTVYDRAHLGNARAAVVYDLLFRILDEVYTKVSYVRNITDVDDKIIAACKIGGRTASDLTAEMTKHYHEDMDALNCLRPTHEPKATEYIPQMIEMIEALIKGGHAYENAGHVLFDTHSFKEYGALSRRSLEQLVAGSRVEVAPYKKNETDFVLWKPSPQDEFEFGFDSPWGRGRPGWHIECSAMSRSLLGENFDIHGGGADLMFPHHENEIAQSVCSSDCKRFANYWVHNGFLMVEGEKMSKSLGNFFTVRQMLDKGIDGSVIRYVFLMTHYRKPIDFAQKAIDDAAYAIEKFCSLELDQVQGEIDEEILEALLDDINTPLALAIVHERLKEYHKTNNKKLISSIKWALSTLGIKLPKREEIEIPKEVKELAERRLEAKKNKEYALADRLRDKILASGFRIEDTKDGNKIIRNQETALSNGISNISKVEVTKEHVTEVSKTSKLRDAQR